MARIDTPVPSGRQRRAPLVAVVDDEAANVDAIRFILAEHGYDVLPAVSGEQALELCAFRKPDLALFDLRMPDMDGLTLCRRFRETLELAAIPVIFITGLADEEILIGCFEAGAVDFLAKPVRAACAEFACSISAPITLEPMPFPPWPSRNARAVRAKFVQKAKRREFARGICDDRDRQRNAGSGPRLASCEVYNDTSVQSPRPILPPKSRASTQRRRS